MIKLLSAFITALLSVTIFAQEDAGEAFPLRNETRERCLSILRERLTADDFWPAMHAAEALTYAGLGNEVLRALKEKTAADDPQRCGLAREAARAGNRSEIGVLFKILTDQQSDGRVHAAESLFKLAEVGDGKALGAVLEEKSLVRPNTISLKMMTAAALARCGHPAALANVRAGVRVSLIQDDIETRKLATWILGQLGSKDDINLVWQQLASATDDLTRAYYAHALALLGDADAKKLMGHNLDSQVPLIRTFAAEFSGYCRATELAGKLIDRLDDENFDVRIRAAQSLLVLSKPPGILELPLVAANEDISRDVYPATAANPRYSEGSIIALADGSLLYATTEFIGGGADFATARIIARTSRDRGRTWGDLRVLQENTGKQNVMSVTLRRLTPGAYDGPIGMFYLVKNAPDDLKVLLRISDNEAKTFGESIVVTSAPGYHVMNNDRVTVLASGRLICPIAWTDDVFKKGDGHFVCFCYFSDDCGKTWQKSAGQVDQPKRGAMEPEVVEHADGQLLMIVRTQLGRIATSVSTDGGNHWSEPRELSVKSPESPATIRRIPATGDLLLIWNNLFTAAANHGGQRTPITAAISSDDGKTWQHIRDLEDDAAASYAYTSVLFHRDRVLLSYYVGDGKSGRISSRFRSLPVRWFYEAP
jgi:sialidase-1